MEQLFKFIVTRPPQTTDPSSATITVRPSDQYHAALAKARASEAPLPAVRRVAAAYRAAARGWNPAGDIPNFDSLVHLENLLGDPEQISLRDLVALLTKLGLPPQAYAAADRFGTDYQKVSDELITSLILDAEGAVLARDLAVVLRSMTLLQRAFAGDKSLEQDGAIADAFARTALLPGDVFPLVGPLAPGDGAAAPAVPPGGGVQLSDLLAKRATLLAAYGALTRITPDQIAEPEAPRAAAAVEVARPGLGAAAGLPGANAAGINRVVRGQLLLKPGATEIFTDSERAALVDLRLDPSETHVLTLVDRLSAELRTTETAIAAKQGFGGAKTVLLGTRYYPVEPAPALGAAVVEPPTTHGNVVPVGIGDLLVVKQFLKRYEAREEAHIENILKGEYKEVKTVRTDTTEETTSTDITTTKEEQRDQQTTERFEMKTETDNVIKADSNLKAGVSVSGSYGPIVEFKASTDLALNNSKEEATKVATDYSKEVTNKASTKISQSVRTQHILKIIATFMEENKHGFDNKGGVANVVGQYQWVDKVYEAQVFNYGKRLMYDVMLPEPAAFVIYAANQTPKAEADLVKPDPFTLKPTDITEWNFAFYVEKYAVVGVDPPPQAYVTVAKAVDGKGDKDDQYTGTKTAELPIPDGYQAVSASVVQVLTFNGNAPAVDVVLGMNAHRFVNDGNWFWWPSLNSEVGSLPVAIKLFNIDTFATTFDITCQRTQRALDDWKLKTHGAILQAYQKQLRDYQEALAAAQVQQAQIQGRNPDANERLIRGELKKGAISLITGQEYDWLNAITTSPEGYPEVDLAAAPVQGPYIRFFEQAFEWEEMMFFFYPYYWARKNTWLDRVLVDDADPLFADFVKAGSARIVVSVRPGFEAAVAYFLQTGQIWNGADLPTISDPLYVSIIEEIKESQQAPSGETPQGDPWDVRLPTTLIFLRDQPTLPSWHKDANGDWVPD